MNVGLLPVDSLRENLALMKVSSAYHKARGDRVEVAFPLAASTYDRIYRSWLFRGSDDPTPWTCEVLDGGPGYDLTTRLPMGDLDDIMPDYGIFGCDHAVGRITRGCPRRCPWCVVWRMDGNQVREVAALSDFWDGQTHLRLLDDNLTAKPDLFIRVCEQVAHAGIRVAFEALDIRFIDRTAARALMGVKRWGNLHFAWDSLRYETAVVRGIAALKAEYPSLHDVLVYVLIGFDTTPDEDLHRVEKLRSLGAMPFVMPFDKSDEYQRRFARWVNHKAIFRSVPWSEYRLGMGHGKAAIA